MNTDEQIYNIELTYSELTTVLEGIRCYLYEILDRIEDDDYDAGFDDEVRRAEGIMHLIMKVIEQ